MDEFKLLKILKPIIQGLEKKIEHNQQPAITEDFLQKAIEPYLLPIKQEYQRLKAAREALDIEQIKADITKSLVVKHQVQWPELSSPQTNPELITLLKSTSRQVDLLQSKVLEQPKIQMEDYKPHDQAIVKGTKISFFGFASPSGAWYIMRQDARKGFQRYAAGNEDYASAWEKREDKKYVILNEAINGY